MTFDLFIPTRQRPRNVHRLLESIEDTAAHPEAITAYFYVDDDDDVMPSYMDGIREAHPAIKMRFAVGPRIVLSQMYTGMAAASTGDILWSGGDDIVFRTPGWDTMIAEEFEKVPDRILLVYGNDCLQEHRLATHPFISRTGMDVLGYFYPATGEIAVTDLWLHHAYETIGRLCYRPDIITEHMHWLRVDAEGNRLAEYDAVYANQYERNFPEVMATLQTYQDLLVRGIKDLARAIGSDAEIHARHPAPVQETPCELSTAEEVTDG